MPRKTHGLDLKPQKDCNNFKMIKIIEEILDTIFATIVGISTGVLIILIFRSLYGLDTQWGKINIDLFPKVYIYIEK
jgi:hypothetical protein